MLSIRLRNFLNAKSQRTRCRKNVATGRNTPHQNAWAEQAPRAAAAMTVTRLRTVMPSSMSTDAATTGMHTATTVKATGRTLQMLIGHKVTGSSSAARTRTIRGLSAIPTVHREMPTQATVPTGAEVRTTDRAILMTAVRKQTAAMALHHAATVIVVTVATGQDNRATTRKSERLLRLQALLRQRHQVSTTAALRNLSSVRYAGLGR